MDILIDGDIASDSCGYPKEIFGIDEACQRVRLVLSTMKGMFIYNRDFGADFSGILSGDVEQSDCALQGEVLCREALLKQAEISVSNVNFFRSQNKLLVGLTVEYGSESKYTEVQIT